LPLVRDFEKPGTSADPAKFKTAAEVLKKALPDNPQVRNAMAWAWVTEQKRNFKSAVIAAAKGVKLAPDDQPLLDTLAHAELAAGHYDGAVNNFRRLKELGFEEADQNLVLSLAARGKDEDKEEVLRLLKEQLKERFEK
jgi:tetratricopeptide (TPR) repeat protein